MGSPPLSSLTDALQRAREIPEPVPYVRAGDPIGRLNELIARARTLDSDVEEPLFVTEDRSGSPSAGQREATVSDAGTPGAIDSLVGRAVLETLATRPLSADARVEAIERLVMAMQNPTQQNLRSVLVLLLRDNEGR